MGTYLTWGLAALLVLVGLVLLLIVPGFGVLALVLVAAGLVWLAVAGLGAAGRSARTSDTQERSREHAERQAR